MPRARLALDGLRIHAARLESITDADTAAKVATSANEAPGSIQNLAKTIADETGDEALVTNVSAFREPAAAAIEWLVTRYVEYVKFQALAEATEKAHPVILKLSEWYDTSASAVALTEFAGAHERFVAAQEKFDAASPPTRAAIDAYVTAAADYDSALDQDLAAERSALKRRALLAGRPLTSDEVDRRKEIAATRQEFAEAMRTLALDTVDSLENASDVDALLSEVNAINQQLADDLQRLNEMVEHAEKAAKVAAGLAGVADELARLATTIG